MPGDGFHRCSSPTRRNFGPCGKKCLVLDFEGKPLYLCPACDYHLYRRAIDARA